MATRPNWQLTYTPGRWVVLAGRTAVVVLQPAPATASALLTSVWEDVVDAEALDQLAARLFTWGLEAMPNLAVLHLDAAGIHALLRGTLTLTSLQGEVLGDGRGALTWHEVTVADRVVRLDLESGQPGPALELPLVLGAVTASSLTLSLLPVEPEAAPEPALRFPTPVVPPPTRAFPGEVLPVAWPHPPQASEDADPVPTPPAGSSTIDRRPR